VRTARRDDKTQQCHHQHEKAKDGKRMNTIKVQLQERHTLSLSAAETGFVCTMRVQRSDTESTRTVIGSLGTLPA
jgi:hypothetical protein